MAQRTDALRGLGDRQSVARLALRFAVASMLLGGAVGLARALVYGLVARAARDVALWSAPAGLVSGLHWREPLERFVLDSLSLGVSVHMGSLSLAFILVIPVAFTWALPLPHRVRAAASMLAICFALGSVILANDLLAIVSRTLGAHGVAVFGPWRTAFYEGWLRMGWDLAMIAVPAGACVMALLPLLGDGGDRGEARTPIPRRRRALLGGARRRRALMGGGVALVLLAIDVGGTLRLPDEPAQERFLRGLEEREPNLARYFLGRGLHALGGRRDADARAFLERARLFPETERQARAGLRQLEGAPR